MGGTRTGARGGGGGVAGLLGREEAGFFLKVLLAIPMGRTGPDASEGAEVDGVDVAGADAEEEKG
ncbi:Hypothetical predicted protein [Prunus dulcis]|nr:Hypothetical predicted protein [Prunus dulcis]